MLVLMDMEWVRSYGGVPCPTQLSALRTDGRWRALARFDSLIRPRDRSCRRWKHMAYSGFRRDDFLNAPSAAAAFMKLARWLRRDDVLCWWSEESARVYEEALGHVLRLAPRHRQLVLDRAVAAALPDAPAGHRALAARRGIPVPEPAHCAANDAEALRLLLEAVDYDAAALEEPMRNEGYAE